MSRSCMPRPPTGTSRSNPARPASQSISSRARNSAGWEDRYVGVPINNHRTRATASSGAGNKGLLVRSAIQR
jgi:hypothetical protein